MKQHLFIALICHSIHAYSQNLIPNPGFEEKTLCPTNHTTQKEPIKTVAWYSPSKGTPDLFSSCAILMMSTPRNFAGTAYPPNGENYVGMYFGQPNESAKRNYREYLTCQLIKRLNKGDSYTLTYYAKPATNSTYLMDRLTFAFSSDPPNVKHDHVLTGLDVRFIAVDTVEVVEGWYHVRHEFIANGTERHLTIGDFTPLGQGVFEKMFTAKSQLKEDGSTYYLFDHFTLSQNKPDHFKEFTLEKAFSLENTYFEFDSFELKESALNELRDLADYLKSKEHLILEVYGNTDVKGSEEYNERLSVLRAKSVKACLEAYGLDPERLKTYGMGERKSIYLFDSLNRRTEFVLLPGANEKNGSR
ncbi:MAG: OmpA family protein [Bacteroidota bacterium]